MRLPTTHSNPLSRAVNLTLGVAVLGSLIGRSSQFKEKCKKQIGIGLRIKLAFTIIKISVKFDENLDSGSAINKWRI